MSNDPFNTEDGPHITVSLKAGPNYKEDMVTFRGSPDDLAEIFGITSEDWEKATAEGKQASTLLKRVKLLGDFNRKQHDAGK